MAMMKRLAAHTQSLQKTFPNVYRDFFARCQQVASASNSFLWAGEFSGFYGGLTVAQKLPIRSYVGFETTFDGQVAVVREYQTFDSEKQEFVTSTADNRLCENLEHYLIHHYRKTPDFTGLRVHLLTEIPLGHSLGSNGAIAAALAILVTGTTEIKNCFACAKEILALSQAGYSSGVTAYMALTDSQEPVVFSAEDKKYQAHPLAQLTNSQLTKAQPTKRQPITSKQGMIWPIDFGLIYSGTKTNAEGVILANEETVRELEKSTMELDQLLGEHQHFNFRQTYIDMLNMTTGLIVAALLDLFKKGSTNQAIEQLFNSLNQYQNLLHVLHVANGATDLIYSRIHQLANKQVNDVGSGVKISGIGKGGAVLFALPYGTHRTGLIELVDRLRQETGRPIWLDYASWLDGIGSQPGKLEQNLALGQVSSLIGRDVVSLSVVAQGQTNQQLITSERLNQDLATIDLLLDTTKGKILIAGQPLTSKELPSQKAAVAILNHLIKAKNHSLRNNQLPASYGVNRYDLQGKIVLPLIKQVKVITGRDLQLIIRGGMYDEYQIILNPSNLVIGVLENKIS